MTERFRYTPPKETKTQLQSGHNLVTYDDDVYSLPMFDIIGKKQVSVVVSHNGERTGIAFELIERSTYDDVFNVNPLQISWLRKRELGTLIEGINSYFQESSIPKFRNKRLQGWAAEGDIVRGHKNTTTVTRQFLEELVHEPLADDAEFDLGPLGSVSVTSDSGQISIDGDRLSVRPNLFTGEQQELNKSAIRHLFERTTHDKDLTTVFEEVLKVGFDQAEKRIWDATLIDGLQGDVDISSENG